MSQMDIAKALGTTQSTVSRQIMKPVTALGASADETTIDGWARNSPSPCQHLYHRRTFCVSGSSLSSNSANQALCYDKTLTGLNLDEDQASRALLRRLIGPQAVLTSVDSRITCPPLA